MSKVQKIRLNDITKKDLTRFLHEFADFLEDPSCAPSIIPDMQHVSQCRISLTRSGEEMRFSMRIKMDKAASVKALPENTKNLPYSELKKRMKKTFTSILKAARKRIFPPRETMRSFLDDSLLMIGYPGFGDEYYEKYKKSCQGLITAWDKGDMSLFQQAVEAVNHQKSSCHGKYK